MRMVNSGVWDFLFNLVPWLHWRKTPDYDPDVDDDTFLREPLDWIA